MENSRVDYFESKWEGKKKSEGCSELMCALIAFIQPKSAMRYMRSFSYKTSNLFFTAQTSGQV